jgi:hypothetical protein
MPGIYYCTSLDRKVTERITQILDVNNNQLGKMLYSSAAKGFTASGLAFIQENPSSDFFPY